MNQIQQQGRRKNQMINVGLQKDVESILAHIHFFAKLPVSPILLRLQHQLKQQKYNFQFHEDYRQLTPINNQRRYKTLVLIQTTKQKGPEVQTIFPKNQKFSSNQTVKILTFPLKMIGSGLNYLATQKDVLDLCTTYFSNDTRHIKLSRVHMIRGSKDKKLQSAKSLKKIITNTLYEKLFIFKDNQTNSAILNQTAQYNRIIEVLQKQKGVLIFRNYKQLQGKNEPNKGRKYLVFGNTTIKSMNNFNHLRKKKDIFDVMIMGELEPKDYLLDQNVALATSQPIDHLNFLIDNQFNSNAIKTLMQNFINQKENKSYEVQSNRLRINIVPENIDIKQDTQNRPISGLTSENMKKEEIGNSLNINANETQTVVQASNPITTKISQIQQAKSQTSQKRKIKRLKSPKQSLTKQKEEDIQVTVSIIKQQNNGNATKEMNQNLSKEIQNKLTKEVQNNITKQIKQNEKQIYQTIKEQQNRINQQNKRNSFNEKGKIQPQSPVIVIMESIENVSTIQTPGEKIFILNKQINNTPNNENYKPDYKDLKNPLSNIIPQMSQEYRGSNLELQNSIKLPKQQSDFIANESTTKEGTGTKKIMKMNLNNQPAFYQGSQQVITQNKGNPIYSNGSNAPMNKPIQFNSTNIYNDGSNEIKVHIHEEQLPNTQSKNTQTDPDQSNIQPYQFQSPKETINTSSFIKIEKEHNQFEARDPTRKSQKKIVEIYDPIGPEEIKSESTYKTITSQAQKKTVSEGYNQYVQQNYEKYTYPSQTQKDYYNVRTLNYHTINNEPYNNKIQISTRPSEHTINNSSTKQPLIYEIQTNPRSNQQFTSIQAKVTTINNASINLEQYQPFIRNGITVYRKRNSTVTPLDNQQYNPPKVYNYQTIPVRKYLPHYKQTNNYTYKVPTPIHNTMESTTLHIVSRPYSIQTSNGTFGEMIDSSLDKNSSNDLSQLIYKGDRFQKQNLRRKLNEIREPRTQVEMIEVMQYKVQAPNHSNQNLLYESNNNSKNSEMYSDTSTMRKNNIKFGIKFKKNQQKSESVSVTDSKNGSGVYGLNNLNKKMALNRIISGQDYLEQQKQKYSSIITKFNCFHFVVAEDMNYLIEVIDRFIATPNDKIESFTGSEEMFECIRPQRVDGQYDVGLIFAKKEQIAYINSNTFPEDYYFVQIDGDRGQILEINQINRRIVMDQIWQLPLAQKILIDCQLDQYIIYHSDEPDIERIAQTFVNSEFFLQKVDGQFSSQTLDYYYCDLPRMVRLYVLCNKKQLHNLLNLLPIYEQINPNFQKESCKLICFLDNSTNNNELIRTHPTVTFLSNSQPINNHHILIELANQQDKQINEQFPIDRVFYHQKHEPLGRKIRQQFPGRFLTIPYSQLIEVINNINNSAHVNTKYKSNQKNYLILHQSINISPIQMHNFTQVYMLGKVKTVQPRVIRASYENQLFQLMKK